jgi:hypothetical protein
MLQPTLYRFLAVRLSQPQLEHTHVLQATPRPKYYNIPDADLAQLPRADPAGAARVVPRAQQGPG